MSPNSDNPDENPTAPPADILTPANDDNSESDVYEDDDVIPACQFIKVQSHKDYNPAKDRTETVLRQDPDPFDDPSDKTSSPELVRVLSHTRNPKGDISYLVQLDNDTYVKDILEADVPQPVIDSYSRQVGALTEQANMVRKRGRPRH